MKKLFVLIMSLFGCLCSNGHSNIPFMNGDESWKRLESYADRVAALQIPKDLLNELSTDSLLDICLNYPYLLNYINYSDIRYGFEKSFNEFNGFKELFSRKDMTATIINKVRELPFVVDSLSKSTAIQRGEYSLTYVYLEYMMCRDDFKKNLTITEERRLISTLSNNIAVMNEHANIFGGMHMKPVRSMDEIDVDLLLSDYGFQKTVIQGFKTPNGTNVYAYRLNDDDFTTDQIAAIYAKQHGDHPDTDSVSIATRTYNCHGYAWHMYDNPLDNPLIIENIHDVNSSSYENFYEVDESYEECDNLSDADIIVYCNENGMPEHSARRLTNVNFRSKWGLGFMFEHSKTDVDYHTNNIKYYKRATPAVYGDTRPCSSTYRVYSLHKNASVSWNFSGGTSSSLITQNSPSANKCTISNSSHTYIKDNLVATVTRSGASTYTVSKAIDTGVNFSGSYTGVYTGLAHSGVTYPAIPSTSISSGNTYPVTAGYTLTLTSSYFQNATVSYSGSAVSSWTNSGNGTITMKLNNSWTTSTVTITGYKGCDVYQIKFFVFANMYALGNPQLVVESDCQTCEIMLAFESDGRLINANELENSSELEWDLTIAHVKTGKIVYDKHLVGPGIKLDTTEWEPGIYVFRAKIGDEVVTQKVVIGKNK